MAADPLKHKLSRRENQIMDIVYELGEATAVQIQVRLPDAPSNSSVRVLLRILEEKKFLTHHTEGGKYVYTPTIPAEKAEQSAIRHLLKTFFGNSAPRAVAALLSTGDLTEGELDELSQLIEEAKKGDQDDVNLDS
ncbi:BlaI/MecI/CopY family transcriptional regulator [Aggregatilinea lenta]|uniref:BlaI/MecI/CopY family transcriptional regulator n=1 Tax=Aggregatilinea lenta TaxID=913108 RepID=UPI000E5B009E|nr:BlaI/MecI/CopY family transcriptional regulator [Aggregatilinea lenta]